MTKSLRSLAVIYGVSAACSAYGYATPTHTAITAEAVMQSNLGDTSSASLLARDNLLVSKLGLKEMLVINGDGPFRSTTEDCEGVANIGNGHDCYIAISSPASLWRSADAEFEKKDSSVKPVGELRLG